MCDECPEYAKQTAAHVTHNIDSDQVVFGPIALGPKGSPVEGKWYFTICTSEAGRGFRNDLICVDDQEHGLEVQEEIAQAICATGKVAFIHGTTDELEAAKLCEELWPGTRITEVRKQIEHERQTKH